MIASHIVYALNLAIGAILAGVMSQYWRLDVRGGAVRWWIVAAWVLTAADAVFVVRAFVPTAMTRAVPTVLVTAGQLLIVLAAQRTMGRAPAVRAAALLCIAHALFLVLLAVTPALAASRSVGNAVVWMTLAFIGASILLRGDPGRLAITRPIALVLAAHGVFHVVRLASASWASAQDNRPRATMIQLAGDLEVSLFMVALFVSVLVAFLQLQSFDIRTAAAEARELSSMLPLCASCGNVRNDSGYWTRIETFLGARQVSVTHGICEGCAEERLGG